MRSPRAKRARLWTLRLQRELGRLVWWPLATVCWYLMAVWKRYRIPDLAQLRVRYRELVEQAPGGVLLCPNHLTMIDSALLVWALHPHALYPFRWRLLPWNVPEAAYMRNPLFRFVCYFAKCVPVARGGSPDELRRVLLRIDALLAQREVVLVFPEGRRSRTGRVDTGQNAHGVGRMVRSSPGVRVICVYIRGRAQKSYGGLPVEHDTIDIRLEPIAPSSAHPGVRGTKEIARQILETLARMERDWLSEHGPGAGSLEAGSTGDAT